MNPSSHANSLSGDWNRSLQGNLPQRSPQTTRFPTITLAIQRYSSDKKGMTSAKLKFSKSNSSNQKSSLTDKIAVLWGMLVFVGIVLLSFGRSVREPTILGGMTVGLAFGITIGYSIFQRHMRTYTA